MSGIVCLQSSMEMEKLVEVIAENHLKGSKRGHKEARKDARAYGIKRKSQIEFDRRLDEIEAMISALTKLLEERGI